MNTIVAITAQNKKEISEHAGKCLNFLIFTIDNNSIVKQRLLELTKEETLHAHFQKENNSTPKSVLFDVDILLTRGIGSSAIQKLANHNVICYKIEETDPNTAIKKLIDGTLEAISPISHAVSGCNCNCGTKHHS